MKLNCKLAVMILLCGAGNSDAQSVQAPLWQSPEYSIYKDSVVQQQYRAWARSATEIVSNYQSPVNLSKSSLVSFKFSINGKDNEMTSGVDHQWSCISKNGVCETPVIEFGKQLKPDEKEPAGFLAPNTVFKIRVDMRKVLADFASKGYYTAVNGDKIYKEDFKGVFVAGNSAPLNWDFDNLGRNTALKLKDDDGDGIYEITLTLNVYDADRETAARWTLTKDITPYPQYNSAYPLTNALYNMALEEMLNAVEPDSTFRTGKEWAGVWTRDISYSIILSMAYLQPRVAQYSLLRKVSKKKKIIQDTGTGGAWPISTDRMVWAIAAWELYKATGDKNWLQEAYVIIKNSLEDDYQVAYDKVTGLVKGESSFLDWREQTYPKWMQPADIFTSKNLGTNAVHYEANRVLSRMAALLGKKAEAAKYLAVANTIKVAVNKYLWQTSKQYYAQYAYGRVGSIVSPKSEALGEALTILFDMADSAKREKIVANVPQTAYGISCIYPQIPNILPYHNDAVWPFVQSFWLWAAAKAGNEQAVTESINAIYRPAALFATNKENFVATSGDFAGTVINSSNMLWSLSGNISIVHKVLFGIHFNESNLSFRPFVPALWKGNRSLHNFKYRDAILNIELEGYGDRIASFELDGKKVATPVVSSILKGTHTIRIVLNNRFGAKDGIHKVANHFAPAAPVLQYSNGNLTWLSVENAKQYKLVRNGAVWKTISAVAEQVTTKGVNEYTVIAVDAQGYESFASEPVLVADAASQRQYEVEAFAGTAAYNYKGFSGDGFTEISTTVNKTLTIPVEIATTGYYLLDWRYANGNGPVNTENKCAIRTLKEGNTSLGTFVFPQRGKDEWSTWGYSNMVKVYLTKGKHNLSLVYLPANENMNGEVNQAMLDWLRVIEVK
ncbi:MAG: trehalase family glycosidase [Chitinophagaceae bacterium]